MGIDKAELKKAILQDMGIKADDRLDALTAELYRTEGAAGSLKTAAEVIERDVFARLRSDLEGGQLDADQAKTVDRYIRTCIHSLQHLAQQSNVQVPIMKGRLDEATEQVKRIKEEFDSEEAKIQAIRIAEAAGTIQETEEGGHEAVPSDEKGPSRRPPGVRPSGSLKDRRAAEGALEPPESPVEDTSEAPVSEEPPETPKASPKRPQAVRKTAPAEAPTPVAPKPQKPAPKPRGAGQTPEDKKAARKEAAKKKRAAAAKQRGRTKR